MVYRLTRPFEVFHSNPYLAEFDRLWAADFDRSLHRLWRMHSVAYLAHNYDLSERIISDFYSEWWREQSLAYVAQNQATIDHLLSSRLLGWWEDESVDYALKNQATAERWGDRQRASFWHHETVNYLVRNRELSDALHCSLDCHFVNWRLSSMYLEGCIPEGYDLLYFYETVNHADFHMSPLFEDGPVEGPSDVADAEAVEGPEYKPIEAVTVNIAAPPGAMPPDRAEEQFSHVPPRMQVPGTHRLWNATSYYWQASLLNHQPLYFEDRMLERHGYSHGIFQPVISGAKFFATFPALPYLMVARPPQTTRYTLGQARPGSPAEYTHEWPPLNFDAATFQAGVTTGLFFLIP
ncbi:MAG: hypothetical protein ACF8PG_17905 [Maioricimonas sp. JB045]